MKNEKNEKMISGVYNKRASYLGFNETFTALFVLNYWLTEFPLTAVVSRCELRCHSKCYCVTKSVLVEQGQILQNNGNSVMIVGVTKGCLSLDC